ncbi:MAG: hypothetical protein R3F14_03460 [Polyangiaceae bacterium]
MSPETARPAIDLETCADEPIHTPGSIQPHGALLAIDEGAETVLLASENVDAHLGMTHAEALGRPLDALLDGPSLARVRASLLAPSLATMNPIAVVVAGRPFEAVLHRADGLLVIELEPPEGAEADCERVGRLLVRESLVRVKEARSHAELVPIVAEEVRRLTGFDRVMVYRLDPRDGHGEVVAESLDPDSDREPYLGLHYPATDIPARLAGSTRSTRCASSSMSPIARAPCCLRRAPPPASRST